jgi:hypothetical protein
VAWCRPSPTTHPTAARAAATSPAALGAVTPTTARTAATSTAALAVALTCLVALAGSALASGDPLLHPVWGPALAAREAAVARIEGSLQAAAVSVARADTGLGGHLDLVPSAAWSGRPGGPVTAAGAVALTGRIEWSDDPTARASALLAQHRARVAAAEAVHRAVREATGAYLDLRRAHVALAQAEAAVTTRRVTFTRAEASVLARGDGASAGAATDVDLEVARLELERVVAGVERAARDVAAAERTAARLGIDVAAAADAHRAVLERDPLEGWRVHLPSADRGSADRESVAVVRRRLERDLALARLARRGAWGLLDDVRFDASRTGRDARLRVGFELDEGRPGAFVEASVRGAARESWSVSVRARVRLDDDWGDELAAARGALEEAERLLAEALAVERWDLETLWGALRDAEEDVAFAERALELGRSALVALDAERLEVAAAARRGEAGAEGRLERFDDVYARSRLGHLRERDVLMRAWERYLRAAERVALALESPFEVRPAAR